MADLAPSAIPLLILAAFAAGFIDSIAGGGGLVVVPSLLLAGFTPVQALGINKLQGLFSLSAATFTYASKGHVDLRRHLPSAALCFLGGLAGAWAATRVPGDLLRGALPFLLVAIALYFAFKPNMDDADRRQRVSPALLGMTLVPLVGFYDGLFGPGAGSFYMLAFVTLAGYGVLKATAHTKLLNLASNLGGFTGFALAGAVHWQTGMLMGIAALIGARLGAGLAIRKGARIIKPLLVVTCFALAARLLLDPANPLVGWLGG